MIDPDDDSVDARRIRERWWITDWSVRRDQNGLLAYDQCVDWILNAPDNLTYREWLALDRPEKPCYA